MSCYVLLAQQVAALISEMQQHLSDGRRGEIVRNGVRVAIAGMPRTINYARACIVCTCYVASCRTVSDSSAGVQAHSSFTELFQHISQTVLRSLNAGQSTVFQRLLKRATGVTVFCRPTKCRQELTAKPTSRATCCNS
jgi:hypothetical protein